MADFSYEPAGPAERAHYEGLWAAAGGNVKGELQGVAAVPFFRKSGVDMNVLKQVWSFCTPTATMNQPQFYNALRYICMFQNGDLPIAKDRLAKSASLDLGLPKFEGVSISAPQPPFPEITSDLHSRYYQIFLKTDADNDG
jgi:hypothetical protein